MDCPRSVPRSSDGRSNDTHHCLVKVNATHRVIAVRGRSRGNRRPSYHPSVRSHRRFARSAMDRAARWSSFPSQFAILPHARLATGWRSDLDGVMTCLASCRSSFRRIEERPHFLEVHVFPNNVTRPTSVCRRLSRLCGLSRLFKGWVDLLPTLTDCQGGSHD
jgi:hypothetical protein